MAAYFNLRTEVVSRCTPCSDQSLQNVKENFKDVIHSTRRMDNIENISKLVHILEKRNALNADSLKDIARILNRPDLLHLLNNGFGLGQHIVYVQPPLHVQQRQQPVQAARVLNLTPGTYQERVYDLIINQIGIKWKDFARNLRISEGQIDELADRYRFEPAERIREILKYHEQNSPIQEFWTRLMDALSNSRRSDLRKDVQQILVQSNLI